MSPAGTRCLADEVAGGKMVSTGCARSARRATAALAPGARRWKKDIPAKARAGKNHRLGTHRRTAARATLPRLDLQNTVCVPN